MRKEFLRQGVDDLGTAHSLALSKDGPASKAGEQLFRIQQ